MLLNVQAGKIVKFISLAGWNKIAGWKFVVVLKILMETFFKLVTFQNSPCTFME